MLWLAWPPMPLTFLLFVSWLPLLSLADNVKRARHFFAYTSLHMLLWNLLVTWWVAMSTVPGGLSAFLVNSLIMCIPWLLYFYIKKYVQQVVALFALVAFWIVYEHIHHNWDLSWPWLALGNAFASKPHWVQWYEYTGTSGGTLWILLANIFIFLSYKIYRDEGRTTRYFKYIATFFAIICLPIAVSIFTGKRTLTLQHNKYNIVVVQPNIDPYQKFNSLNQAEQLNKLISLSQSALDANTALVIWPETAVPRYTNENALQTDDFLKPLWGFLRQNPNINLLTGIEGYKHFPSKISRYAKQFPDSDGFYESYNSAALFDSASAQIYHKSKLVPGVEVLPGFLNFMSAIFEKFGGTTGGYARDSVPRVLKTSNKTFNITPAVCYESIYSDYLADFNRHESNLICIITNDGWWGNTAGYKQHKDYARLRAIESRKWVARSANTGISCFIDPYGNVVQQLGWNKKGTLKQTVGAFVTETFYTKHGDLLSKTMSWAAAAFLLFGIFMFVKRKI